MLNVYQLQFQFLLNLSNFFDSHFALISIPLAKSPGRWIKLPPRGPLKVITLLQE